MQIVDPSLLGNLSPSTLATSLRSQPSSYLSESTSVATPNHNELQIQQNATPASIVINISDGGSTGRGIIIGLLSAFGSAGIAVLVLAIFFFFKYTNRGRILLDRIGRPGEFDDEQAFIKEEAEALEQMDEMQKAEYMRAKGEIYRDFDVPSEFLLMYSSIRSSKSARDHPDRHIAIAVPCYPRKRRFSMGIRTRT